MAPKETPATKDETVRDKVRAGYRTVALQGSLDCGPNPTAGCCGSSPDATLSAESLAVQVGYAADELKGLPEGANMGLSCGNPGAIAALEPGQVVLDLGSGGGFDVFLAGPKVGQGGRVIGVDMTAEMLSRARKNAQTYREQTGLDNVEFRLGEIEHLPVADDTVDVVMSNCVINLSPDKPQVWKEVTRVLRPGGRVAASDVALLKPLPEPIVEMIEALVGCVAGAVLVEDYRQMVEAAGLTDVSIEHKPGFVEAMAQSNDTLFRQIAEHLPADHTASDYITSIDVTAVKAAQE